MPPLSSLQKKCVALAIGQTLFVPSLSQAATITVNTTSDLISAQECTLREAIAITNSANSQVETNGCNVVGDLSSNNQINFDLADNSTIQLSRGMLEITSTVSINGPGAELLTIDANKQSRVLRIYGADNTKVDKLTLTGGLAVAKQRGGGIDVLLSQSVTISNSIITKNQAGGGAGINIDYSGYALLSNVVCDNNIVEIYGGHGGGVDVVDSPHSKFDSVTIIDNIAPHSAGVNVNNSDFFEIVDSVINDNLTDSDGSSAGRTSGGGIGVFSTVSLSITNTTISGNSSNYLGGGINLNQSPYLTINKSTIANNKANMGGGINIIGGETSLINSTISGNVVNQRIADGRYASKGGGIAVEKGSLSIYNSTINANQAFGVAADLAPLAGGIYTESLTSLPKLVNTVVANSSAGDCNRDINNINNNWFEDNSCSGSAFGDPLLGPLQDNGGPTLTHAPLVNSGLIDAGLLSACQTLAESMDQRNEPRGDTSCFIGSVEDLEEQDETLFVVPINDGKSVIFVL